MQTPHAALLKIHALDPSCLDPCLVQMCHPTAAFCASWTVCACYLGIDIKRASLLGIPAPKAVGTEIRAHSSPLLLSHLITSEPSCNLDASSSSSTVLLEPCSAWFTYWYWCRAALNAFWLGKKRSPQAKSKICAFLKGTDCRLVSPIPPVAIFHLIFHWEVSSCFGPFVSPFLHPLKGYSSLYCGSPLYRPTNRQLH